MNKTTFASNVWKFSTRINSQSLSHAKKYVFMQINLKGDKTQDFPPTSFFLFFFKSPYDFFDSLEEHSLGRGEAALEKAARKPKEVRL